MSYIFPQTLFFKKDTNQDGTIFKKKKRLYENSYSCPVISWVPGRYIWTSFKIIWASPDWLFTAEFCFVQNIWTKKGHGNNESDYHTRTIITRAWFETADFRSNFPCLCTWIVCNINLSGLKTALKNGVKNIQTAGYNGARTVVEKAQTFLKYTLFPWCLFYPKSIRQIAH